MKWLNWLLVFGFGLVLVGCGGSFVGFDEFSPRPAVHADFAERSFDFDWFPTGNPIEPTLGEFRISFTGDPAGSIGSFILTETGVGTASGAYSWSAPLLTLKVNSVGPGVHLAAGSSVVVVLESDASDGRIRLTNESTGSSSTSRLP